MGRTLLHLGLVTLAGAVWLFLGGQVEWLDASTADRWGPVALKAGLGCVAAGLLLRVVSPVERRLRSSRCARCQNPTEPGHVYCRDHMKKAMNEFRDQAREGMLRGPGTR